MRIPFQNKDKRERTMIKSFGGYDRRGDTSEGSFFDMINMSSDKYPCLTTRKKRSVADLSGAKVFNIMCLDIAYKGEIIKNALVADCENRIKSFFIEDGELQGHDVFNTTTLLTQAEKQFVVDGTRVYFFPDGVYYDMMEDSVGALELKVTYQLGNLEDGYYEITLEPCDIDGNDSDEASPYRRVRRSCYKNPTGTKGEFIKHMAFSDAIKKNDTVELKFTSNYDLNGFYNIVNRATDKTFLVVESEFSGTIAAGELIISRSIPKMDFVVSAKNRLWGCRYGMDAYGNCVNEIYASAHGDPTNWYRFSGVSTDSWSASIGCPGAFTGAVTMDGNPVFFKEDAIIKVFGSYPSEFCVTESAHRGIEAGSEKSAVFVNDDLYYKTYSGIVRYDGGMPVNVDSALGGDKYKNAVAGTTGDKYYVSMEDSKGNRTLFVYDISRRMWHKEDNVNVKSFCRCGSQLYFLCDEDGESKVYCVSAVEGLTEEKGLSWMCESTRIGFENPDRKYISSLALRIDCPRGSYCQTFVEYDGDGVWHRQRQLRGQDNSVLIRLRPRRCDFFKIRIKGEGECTIRSITRTIEGCNAFH